MSYQLVSLEDPSKLAFSSRTTQNVEQFAYQLPVTIQLELVESMSGAETIPKTVLKLGNTGGTVSVSPTPPSRRLEPIRVIQAPNASFSPCVDSEGVYGLDRMEQLRVWKDAEVHKEKSITAWDSVLEVDAKNARAGFKDAGTAPTNGSEDEHRPVSFQQLLEENAALIMHLHKMQEERLLTGALKPSAQETQLAKEIQTNLAALADKSKPKDLIGNPEAVERAMQRIPRVAEAWMGTLPPISSSKS